MYLSGKHLDEVTGNDIERLVDLNVLETRLIEYKLEINLSKDLDKKEFLADIAAFANTDGGVIICGIKEDKENGKIELVGLSDTNTDLLIQKIESILFVGIEQKVLYKIKVLKVRECTILIIGIDKNWNIPSMVNYNHTNKFYKRRDTGKYLVDVYELSEMFMATADIITNTKEFINNRIIEQRSKRSLPIYIDLPSLFLHIVPLNGRQKPLDLSNVAVTNYLAENVRVPFTTGWDHRLNLDGFLIYRPSPTITNYVQVFRNGAFEFYTSSFHRKDNNGLLIIYGDDLELVIMQSINSSLKILKNYNLMPPFAIFVYLVNVYDCSIQHGPTWSRPLIEKNEMYLPVVVFNSYTDSISSLMKPIFDIFWQSASYQKSPNYDDLNNYKSEEDISR